jgi:integrase
LDEREGKIKSSRQRANEWRSERGYALYSDLSDHEFADYLKPAVLLTLNTGLRRSELLNLKWSDIDFKQKNLTVVGDGAKTGQT